MAEASRRAVCKAAFAAYEAGLCVLPPLEDGSKAPQPNANGKWNPYKAARPTCEEMETWYPGRSGLGLVAGQVSGYVESWDFDDRTTYDELLEAANASGLSQIVGRVESGYCDDTPNGGVR